VLEIKTNGITVFFFTFAWFTLYDKNIVMKNIPSVDLNDFLSEDHNRKQKFVNELGKAYEDIGFVALKGLSR